MSLRLRLAAWFGVLCLLATLLIGALTYVEHTRAHYDALDQDLVGTTTHVADEMASITTAAAVQEALAVPLLSDVVVRAYDRNGVELADTPGDDAAPAVDPRAVLAAPSGGPLDPLAALAVPLIRVNRGSGHFGLIQGPDGVRWRLYVLPVAGPARYLVAESSLARLDALLTGLRVSVAVSVVAVTLVAVAFGWLVAGWALRPVDQLTATAETIAHSSTLAERVAVGNPRDEMGRMAATFNAMLDSLERSNQRQQRFVADASHELRAPLTAIQANLDLLVQQTTMPAEDRDVALGEARREAHRLARLVADLLALARADAGLPVARERVELDRVVLEALRDARHLAHGQRLEVAALEPVLVRGDPDRLKQLFLILLDNAVKYTPADGVVTLSLRRDGAVAAVVVRDTGIGIPPEDLPYVFDRFYRADPARGRDPGGTGLGLAIARWIAEQHGGTVSLTSQVPNGTTATVTLPTVD